MIQGLSRFKVIDPLVEPQIASTIRESVDHAGELIASALAASETMHFVGGTSAGVITACNGAMTHALGLSQPELVGTKIWGHLAEPDGAALRERIVAGRSAPNERFPLTFARGGCDPVVLSCWMDVQPTHFTLIAEPSLNRNSGYDDQLYATNNELSVLARENARRGKELAAAKAQLQETLDELNRTHWHLRKVAEVLPMCAECGRVKPGDDEKWGSVADYLRENSLFLSHGCCPDCAGRLLAGADCEATA